MNYSYDPVADAVNLTFKRGKVAETREIAPGIMVDLDSKGIPLYVEILDASKRFSKKHTRKEGVLKSVR
ncbi:MAG: DUF2283 domain-containing protein [bacterium]|nr:DUF2283 domain-containing protein [bacterium]